jgi:hypothetical protein
MVGVDQVVVGIGEEGVSLMCAWPKYSLGFHPATIGWQHWQHGERRKTLDWRRSRHR